MNPASEPHRELARRLLDAKLGSDGTRRPPGDVAELVCQHFYRALAPLVMLAGSQAFLSRALQLTRADIPWLMGLRAGPSSDPCFEGMDEALRGVDPEAALDAFEMVFAHMIGLLVTFIGEDLAMHAVTATRPEPSVEPPNGGLERR